MDACGVVTDRGTYIALERRTEGEVAADAETHDSDFPWCDLRMFGKPVQTSAAIGIEMRDRSLHGVLLAADTSGVIESDHGSRWFAIRARSPTTHSFLKTSQAAVMSWP